MDKDNMIKLVSELKEDAISGREESKIELYRHYYELYYDYVNLYSDIENVKEIYLKIIMESVDKLLLLGDDFKIHYVIQSKFMKVVREYSKEYNKQGIAPQVNQLLEQAITSKEARNMLVERYMYLIEKYLKKAKFNDTFTKEDAYQEGCLFLINKIDNYFEKKMYNKFILSVYLNNTVRDIYVSYLTKENQFMMTEVPSGLLKLQENLIDGNFEFEWNDFVDSSDLSPLKKEALKYVIGNKNVRIAEELQTSRQGLSQHIASTSVKVKSFFEK